MSWLALAVAVLVVVGAVVALSARDPRLGIVGLAGALALAPLAAEPLPDPLAVAARILAAAMATYLVMVPVREAPSGPARRPAWPAEAFGAGALFVAGAVAHATILGGTGSQAATAAAVTLAGLAVIPLVDRGDGPRTAFAVLLAVAAADLAWAGLVGPPTAFEALVVSATLIAVAAAATVVVAGPGPVRDRHAMAGVGSPAHDEPDLTAAAPGVPSPGAPSPEPPRPGRRLPRPPVRRPGSARLREGLGRLGEKLGRIGEGLGRRGGGLRRVPDRLRRLRDGLGRPGRDEEPGP